MYSACLYNKRTMRHVQLFISHYFEKSQGWPHQNLLFFVMCELVLEAREWKKVQNLTASFTVDSAAMIQAAETLAIRVPNGNHLNNPALPNPRPLSRAKNHLIHTPGGPTMHANHSWAPLLPLLNSSFNSAPLKPHNKTSIKTDTTMTAKWRLLLSTLQLLLELQMPLPQLPFNLVRIHLKPLAVSTPTIME